MKNVIFQLIDKLRSIKSDIFTFWLKQQVVEYGPFLRAATFSQISRTAKVKIGKCSNFNGFIVTGCGGVKIGSYFHSGTNVKIMLGSHDYEYGDKIPYGIHYTKKYVEIDDFVWIGSDVTICGNVHIGEGAIVALGSLVVKDVPPYAIVGGNPAKIIKYRNIEQFKRLKEEKKYRYEYF